MIGEHDNAIAGPSNIRATYSESTGLAPSTVPTSHSHDPMNLSAASPLFPLLYLPPAGPTPPRQHLASTQDLLSRLQLLPAYDKYVRPPQSSLDGPLDVKPNLNGGGNTNTQLPNPMSPLIDKGKGREVPVRGGDVDMHDPNDGDEDDVGGKKKRNNYKHLIRGIPGKHSMKKDDYLEKMMLVPPKQRIRIRRFDERTQEDAFSVTLEGLKGWNINTLIMESPQAREDRKKRKEAKKAAKIQVQLAQQSIKPMPPISPSTSTHIAQPQPVPIMARSISTPKQSVGTPRPGSTSVAARPTVRVGSTLPRPESAVPKSATPNQEQAGTPLVVRRGTPMEVDQQRGKKRDREEGPLVNGGNVNVNGALPVVANGYANVNGLPNTNGPKQAAISLNAKAGTGNVRPRPIKKQRMDMSGQAREVTAPVQQPTPQGV